MKKMYELSYGTYAEAVIDTAILLKLLCANLYFKVTRFSVNIK